MTEKKLKIVFSPGCFDDFDGTQEELDALIKEIENQIASGTFLENSVEITEDELLEVTESVSELLNQKRTLQ